MTATLVLLRHGQSEWNEQNLFTGWFDAKLTEQGKTEAREGGKALLASNVTFDHVYTSLQTRAIDTANLALAEMDMLWLPVTRTWRLNERHYGDLQGKDKKETSETYGVDQVKIWRRSFDVPPPALSLDDPRHPSHDKRYAHLPLDVLPASECLKDVIDRMLPFWFDRIAIDLQDGKNILVVAHGNSLRALVKHLEHISDDDIASVNLPTGVPIRFDLDKNLQLTEKKPLEDRFLGDIEKAKADAAAVAAQAG